MDPGERALLDQTVTAALMQSRADHLADPALEALGWLELLDAEPDDAIAVVFEALGATSRSSTALDDVLATALGTKPCPDLAVLLPTFGAWDPPTGVGLATARVATACDLLVAGRTVPTTTVDIEPVQGLDPSMGMHLVRGAAGDAVDEGAWAAAVALGRRAAAHEIAGASRAMLALAREHALERVQFGRPIGSFQAVRHRLADALVAVEALDATLEAASGGADPTTAALAKATAGRTLRTVATHCQQVLAGIGFTTDHPFHRYVKRAMVLEGLFGSADGIAIDLGCQLLANRRVPTLIEL
jgi:hypothetical protein